MASQMVSPKRRAIADSSRTMFIWVAGMSAVVGVCVVVAIFLVQQIMFKVKVVGAMTDTVNTLNYNNRVAKDLTSNVVVLQTNSALNSVKANGDENALQVPLDALPADRNSLALGASLQQVLLSGVDGLSIDSLSVDTVDPNANTNATDTTATSDNTISIQMQISSGNVNTIKDTLARLENSIRIIDIDSFILERSDTTYQATITAHAYYQPGIQLQLQSKSITPGGK